MAKVEVISTTMIQPKTSTSTHQKDKKIDLTSNDVPFLLVGPIQKGLLFSKPFSSEFHQTLQASLSNTLDIFFPLAGRFSTTQNDENTIAFSIDCNDTGVHYVRAVAGDVTVSDILDPVYVPPFIQSFFPLNGLKNYEGTSNPLLAVQVTELSDGIFIGCTVSHSVSDGASFWNFMNFWSEICRCFPDEHIPETLPTPIFENWFRGGNNCPMKLPVSIFKTDDPFTPPPLQERIFNFSKEKIAELKEKANSEARSGTLEERKVVISSLHSLLAHIWRSVIRSGSGQLDHESGGGGEETIVRVLVGLRSILELPEGYFGNAIQSATMRMKVKELEEKGIGEVALAINKTVGNFTEENVRKNLSESMKNPDIIRLGGLIMTSNPKFDIYGNDFGWGKPIAVRSGVSHKFDGMITLYPGVVEGSLDVEICSSLQALEALAIDSEFMEFVTIKQCKFQI